MSTFSNLSCFPTNKKSTNDSPVSSFIPAKTEEKRRQTSRQIWGSGDTKSTKTYFLRNPNLLCFPARETKKHNRWADRQTADLVYGDTLLGCPRKSNLLSVSLLVCRVFWFFGQQIWLLQVSRISCFSVPESICLSARLSYFFLAGCQNYFCPRGR